MTAQVISALRKVSEIEGAGIHGGLFGWDPDPVAPAAERGIACAIRITGANALAAALAVTTDGGAPRVSVVAKGDAAQSAALPIDAQWSLTLGAHAADILEVSVPQAGKRTSET